VRIIKVLIVEDSPDLCDRWRILLADLEGIEIVGQADGPAEAITLLRRTEPGAVLLDFRLKGGNGLPVLREAKKRQPPPKVIVLTNHHEDQVRQACLDAGADHFFDKSTGFDQAVHILECMVGSLEGIAVVSDGVRPEVGYYDPEADTNRPRP
jgi:DNA-binding NarL/FixJ family response regulator